MSSREKTKQLLFRGSVDVIEKDDLLKRLDSNKPLKVKYGIDPTASRIHIGRAATMRKLKYFQQLGHQVQIVIGSFTGQIGDSSDKESERPMLTAEEIRENFSTYKEQLAKIFDIGKIELYYNHEWFEKMQLSEFFKLQNMFSVAQMIERDNFAKRFQEGKRIGLHEFSYALLQGYDSVAMRSDVEIGGTDQLFNLLAGRTIQKNYGLKPQNIVTYELLMGLDGRKMSTTWGNCIYIDDTPEDMYAKVMRVNDSLMWDYFRLSTELSDEELEEIQERLNTQKENRELKGRLAYEITKLYHGESSANAAQDEFEARFGKTGKIDEKAGYVKQLQVSSPNLVEVMVELGFASSKSEARRLIDQKGVRVDSETASSYNQEIRDGQILQVGKRQVAKVQLKD